MNDEILLCKNCSKKPRVIFRAGMNQIQCKRCGNSSEIFVDSYSYRDGRAAAVDDWNKKNKKEMQKNE